MNQLAPAPLTIGQRVQVQFPAPHPLAHLNGTRGTVTCHLDALWMVALDAGRVLAAHVQEVTQA